MIARSNFRKSKGQMISIAAIMLIVGMMLNLWLILQFDYKKNFDRNHDKLNAEHVMLAVSVNSEKERDAVRKLLVDTMEHDGRTDEFYMDDAVMFGYGSFECNDGAINSNFIYLDRETAVSRPIGQIEIVEDSDETSGVYMPFIYKSEDIAIGKEVKITIGTSEMCYTVCGFTNSVMAGSNNCSVCELVLTEDKYKELKKMAGQGENMLVSENGILCSVRLKDKADCENYYAMLRNKLSTEYPSAGIGGNYYTMVIQARYISQMICAGIISAMAFLILLIALVIIASNIINYIQENMKKLGVLKAIGYTGNQIISAFQIQFLSVSLTVVIVGASLSYCIFPVINEMMISQTGIPYQMHFLPVPFLITVGILGGTVFLTVWTAVGRVKKLEPIIALRQGIQTHSFKKNHVRLEQVRLPLNGALALKTTFGSVKNNVTICISMLVVTLVLAFSAVVTENVIFDIDTFINMIVGETTDSAINITHDIEDEFLQIVSEDERVEKVYLYNAATVSHVDGEILEATIIDNYEELNNQDVIIKGRFPKYDNEIAIAAKYAKRKDLDVGDEIVVAIDGTEGTYLISGFTQVTNQLGLDCILTRDGYMKFGHVNFMTYSINLKDGTDVDVFNTDMEARFGNNINGTINVDAVVYAGSLVYVKLMTMIVIGILILSVCVIAFVLYLLVRTRLGNKKQDYGIMKSLGFTTKLLIIQNSISFMPPVILSTIVGLLVSSVVINPLIAVFLSGIGIVKSTFRVPVGMIIVEGIVTVIITFLILCFMSRKIKKLSPHALLTGE